MKFAFGTGRPMFTPHTSGLLFGSVDYDYVKNLPTELTASEQNNPFAKYYYEEMGAITEEHKAAIASAPLAPEDCYMPAETASHMNKEGEDGTENAYGVLENGVGFAKIRVFQDGITDEMIQYFNENFAHFETMLYKLWFPGAHKLHYVNGAIENFGWDMLNMQMTFTADLESLGFSEETILKNDPNLIMALTASGLSTSVTNPMKGEEVMSMFQYTRSTPAGREFRIRYWVGLAFDDFGKPFVKIAHDDVSTVQRAKLMMEHCIREYSNLNRLVKQFWEETH